MIYSRADFSKVHNVSRSAITQAVNNGSLVLDAGGMIDERHKKNQAWIERRNTGKKNPAKNAPEKPTAKKPVKEKAQRKPDPDTLEEIDEEYLESQDGDDSDFEEYGVLSIAKIKAEIRLKHEQADVALQKRLERMGELIDREIVRKAIAKLGQEIKSRFLEPPARWSSVLMAMARSGQPDIEGQRFLENEISKAINDLKNGMQEF